MDLSEVEEILRGVTPGPWKAAYSKWEPNNFIVQTDHPCRRVLAQFDGDGDGPDAHSLADARFIAFARQWVPEAVARISALTETVEELRYADRVHASANAGMKQRLENENATLRDRLARMEGARFYIDCEFDGHDGHLLSIAMVREDGYGLHVMVAREARDPWVIANVVPVMSAHRADKAYVANLNDVGGALRDFIGDCQNPTIIADSPVDIGRFCRAISTGSDGGWASADYPGMTFIVRNVECYPTKLEGAVQHNAWWDAMALRAALTDGGSNG